MVQHITQILAGRTTPSSITKWQGISIASMQSLDSPLLDSLFAATKLMDCFPYSLITVTLVEKSAMNFLETPAYFFIVAVCSYFVDKFTEFCPCAAFLRSSSCMQIRVQLLPSITSVTKRSVVRIYSKPSFFIRKLTVSWISNVYTSL